MLVTLFLYNDCCSKFLLTERDSIYESPDTRQRCESDYDGPSVRRGVTNEMFTICDAPGIETGENNRDNHSLNQFVCS